MNRKLNPKSVRGAVEDAVWEAVTRPVYDAVEDAVSRDVWWVVWGAVDEAVTRPVYGAVEDAVFRAALADHPHPNRDQILTEVRQTRGSAP